MIARFRGRIKALEAFNPQTIQDRSDPTIDALEASIGDVLSDAFGNRTPAYLRYASAATLDAAPVNYTYSIPLGQVVDGLRKGKERGRTDHSRMRSRPG